jgi:hypothetical protein
MTSLDWEKRIGKLMAEMAAAVPSRIMHADEKVQWQANVLIEVAGKLAEARNRLETQRTWGGDMETNVVKRRV